ncbi:hypothetical protein [Helicobacter heilmannii]|uniref:hypothetical protein n=1 Tax=Helicobacter heilmannii TaxID=35817 RepID=UPI0006A24706|nr:hypothetical protein [Helicobacter heilmannii]CRF45605.1 hypothetical protein HHE014_05710 [Helicobacter heilmannii]
MRTHKGAGGVFGLGVWIGARGNKGFSPPLSLIALNHTRGRDREKTFALPSPKLTDQGGGLGAKMARDFVQKTTIKKSAFCAV